MHTGFSDHLGTLKQAFKDAAIPLQYSGGIALLAAIVAGNRPGGIIVSAAIGTVGAMTSLMTAIICRLERDHEASEIPMPAKPAEMAEIIVYDPALTLRSKESFPRPPEIYS